MLKNAKNRSFKAMCLVGRLIQPLDADIFHGVQKLSGNVLVA